jgi:hypothetical protein
MSQMPMPGAEGTGGFAGAPLAYASVAAPRGPDEGHLQALAICHYVFGGMSLLFSCIFIIYIVMGVAVLSGSLPMNGPPGSNGANAGPPVNLIGGLFVAIGCVALAIGWTLGGLTVYSGRCIAKRRRRTFSMVIAGICCISIPLGTVLGIFTLIVLQRESVRGLYVRHS